jgi:hypothetical protein
MKRLGNFVISGVNYLSIRYGDIGLVLFDRVDRLINNPYCLSKWTSGRSHAFTDLDVDYDKTKDDFFGCVIETKVDEI